MCNLKPACFSMDRDFLSVFASCSSNLTFLTLKEKSWFYYRRVFKDYWIIHLTPFSDKKLQLFCSRSHRNEFQDISAVCLPFISGNIFLPMADDQTMFSFVVSKVQNEQGILLFVHWKLNLRIICFRCLFGLPVWNFGHLRVNSRRLWQPGTR